MLSLVILRKYVGHLITIFFIYIRSPNTYIDFGIDYSLDTYIDIYWPLYVFATLRLCSVNLINILKLVTSCHLVHIMTMLNSGNLTLMFCSDLYNVFSPICYFCQLTHIMTLVTSYHLTQIFSLVTCSLLSHIFP